MAEIDNLVVGRGRLYFDRFVAGTTAGIGELYIGNTPTFIISQAATKLDHYNSDHGLKQKDRSVTLQNDMTGKYSTDNINPDNMATIWRGEYSTLTVAAVAAPGVTETRIVYPGREYQLGVSTAEPQGKRQIVTPTVKVTATGHATVDAANYSVDLELGRLIIKDGAPDVPPEGVSWDLTMGQTAYTRSAVVSQGETIYGALRFIADNPEGLNQDVFCPYVEMSPNGDYEWKGDTWQVMNFDLDILTLGNFARMYIDGRPVV